MRKTRPAALCCVALLCALGLAGCVQPPERPLDAGERFAFRTALTPYSAAICIGRNAKSRPGVAGEERTLGESGMEVVVRALGGSGAPLAVAQILRDGIFSNITILVAKRIGSDPAGFARALMAGC